MLYFNWIDTDGKIDKDAYLAYIAKMLNQREIKSLGVSFFEPIEIDMDKELTVILMTPCTGNQRFVSLNPKYIECLKKAQENGAMILRLYDDKVIRRVDIMDINVIPRDMRDKSHVDGALTLKVPERLFINPTTW